MSRRYHYRRSRGGDTFEGVVSLFFLIVLCLAAYFYIYPEALRKFEIFAGILSALLVVFICIMLYRKWSHDKALNSALDTSDQVAPLVNNFIASFGHEKTDFWTFRGYSFTEERLKDFLKEMKGIHVPVSESDFKDADYILRKYIDIRESNNTHNRMIPKSTRKFSDFSKDGKEFERLIARLYEANGYTTQVIGAHGDQGGDVIASRNGENVLIQAKFWGSTSVGNKAVQEAAAARPHYNCTRAVVITTSGFTPEAKALAQTNDVELVDGEELKRRLGETLHESWS